MPQSEADEWRNKVATAERTYGKHAALRMKLDRATLAQFQRLPGVSSSFAGLDAVLQRDTRVEFSDFLNSACLGTATPPPLRTRTPLSQPRSCLWTCPCRCTR